MNFLKKYSTISRISYSSIRTFAYASNRPNAPIGSFTKNTATETSSSGIGIRSASPSQSPSFNSSTTGASGRNPEYMTSTDTRFNSFNTSGSTSRFKQSESQDFASSTKRFADSTADSLKNLADQAANTAKGFVDQAAGASGMTSSFDRDMTGRRDQSYYQNERERERENVYGDRNRSRSPIDDLVTSANSVAQGIGNLAQGAINAATSFGSTFIPQGNQNQSNQRRSDYERRPYLDEHDHNRDARIREAGGNQDIRFASSSFDQNQNYQRRTRDPVQEIGQFVNSTATNMRDAANQAADTARGVFDQVSGTNQNQNPNYQADPNAQMNSQTQTTTAGGSPFETAQALAGTAANLAGYAIKGMADNAAYIASAFIPSGSTSSTSAFPNTSSHTERSANFNTQRPSYDYNYSYNPYASTENRRVEHLTSTDPRFNAFSSAGHVSGFGSPWMRSFGTDDISYAARNFASNMKGAVDEAAETAKDFVDRGSGYMSGSGNPASDLMNQAVSTAQGIAGQTAYVIGTTLNTMVYVASSVANSFAPQGGQKDYNQPQYDDRYRPRNTYAQDQNYINTNGYNNGRRPQDFTSTDTSTNFFNPGQGSGNHPVSPFDNPIGNFVSSMVQGNPVSAMIQGAVNTASSFIPGAGGQQQNPNFFRQNQYSSSQDNATNPINSAVQGAANVAQGLANTAASIASTFIPGGGSQNQRNPSR